MRDLRQVFKSYQAAESNKKLSTAIGRKMSLELYDSSLPQRHQVRLFVDSDFRVIGKKLFSNFQSQYLVFYLEYKNDNLMR